MSILELTFIQVLYGDIRTIRDTGCLKIMSMNLKGTINYSVSPLIVDKKILHQVSAE